MSLTVTSGRPWRGLIILLILPLWLGVMSPAMAGTGRCTTYEEKTMNRLHTFCDDGTRAVSRYNRILDRWETTITTRPHKSCTTRMDPLTKQAEVRCR
jgi:hypothetical protein